MGNKSNIIKNKKGRKIPNDGDGDARHKIQVLWDIEAKICCEYGT